jgi:hypothetical protein
MTADEREAVRRGVERAAEVLDDIVEEVGREVFASEAAAYVTGEAPDVPLADAARGAIAKRLEWLDESFLAALGAYSEVAARAGNEPLVELLALLRGEVLAQVGAEGGAEGASGRPPPPCRGGGAKKGRGWERGSCPRASGALPHRGVREPWTRMGRPWRRGTGARAGASARAAACCHAHRRPAAAAPRGHRRPPRRPAPQPAAPPFAFTVVPRPQR